MRKLRTKKGLEVYTDLSDDEAATIASTVRTDRFATDLATKYRRGLRLSEDQLTWLHKFALEATGKCDQVTLATGAAINLLTLYQLVKRGHRGGGGFPLLRVPLPDKRILLIGLKSGATSHNPWQVQIKCGNWEEGGYLGRIDGLGMFFKSKECGNDVVAFLQELAANPALTLGTIGRAIGVCPLCGQDLTTACAAANGYGHACAVRYGLPWVELESL